MVSEMKRAYEAGEWCGECRFGVVENPPCCRHSNEAIDAAYNAVTGADDEGWGPERSLDALRDLYAAGVAEGIRQAREAVRDRFDPDTERDHDARLINAGIYNALDAIDAL